MKAQRKADEGLDSSFYTGNEKQNMNVSILSKSKLDLSQTSNSYSSRQGEQEPRTALLRKSNSSQSMKTFLNKTKKGKKQKMGASHNSDLGDSDISDSMSQSRKSTTTKPNSSLQTVDYIL